MDYCTALVGGVLFSFGVVVYNVAQVSFRQRLCPPALLGRMNASVRFIVWGTLPLGGLLGGTAGGMAGAKLGQVIDERVLENNHCLNCGHTFSNEDVEGLNDQPRFPSQRS